MLIGIDGNEANIKKRVGSNIYAYELLKKLKSSNKLDLTVYLSDSPIKDMPRSRYLVLKPSFLWTQWRLPLELYLNKKLNLFFTPGHYAPRFCPCPSVVSIMDLAFLRFPEQFRKKDLWQLKAWTNYSVKQAAHVFTISQFTKKEIIHFYNYPEDQITVTYPGVQNYSKSANPNTYGDYFLYIGTLQPRKNLLRLIEAIKITGQKLIVVGKKGWLYENILDKASEQVVFTGFVSDKKKVELISNAKALILPSLYEGFGIPVAEAMRLKCPVIVSKNSSLEEIVGINGIYIQNPLQVASIVASLRQMLQLSTEKRRSLVDRAYKASQQFTWENCAKKTLEVLWSLSKTKTVKP